MYNLYPFKGIEIISFGMNRHDCRMAIGSEFKTFKRNDFVKNTTDYFPASNFSLEFDEDDICQAIELAHNRLLYDGRNLFSYPFSELVKHYTSVSRKYEIEGNQYVTFFDLGFGVSRTAEGDGIESILAFSEKYWKAEC